MEKRKERRKMIISLDSDGTLLDSSSKVPESTQKYLNELKQRGEIVVINSGRSIKEALEVTEYSHNECGVEKWLKNFYKEDKNLQTL